MKLFVDESGVQGPIAIDMSECKTSCAGTCKKLLISLNDQTKNTYICTTPFDLITFQMVTGIVGGLTLLLLAIILLITVFKCIYKCMCKSRWYAWVRYNNANKLISSFFTIVFTNKLARNIAIMYRDRTR